MMALLLLSMEPTLPSESKTNHYFIWLIQTVILSMGMLLFTSTKPLMFALLLGILGEVIYVAEKAESKRGKL